MVTREYTFDLNNPEEAAIRQLQMHIDTLVSLRGRTSIPEELEWEIRLYKYMQSSPSPAASLEEYHRAREILDDNGNVIGLRSKRGVIDFLGWVVH